MCILGSVEFSVQPIRIMLQNSGPQLFCHQGLVLWKTFFQGLGGNSFGFACSPAIHLQLLTGHGLVPVHGQGIEYHFCRRPTIQWTFNLINQLSNSIDQLSSWTSPQNSKQVLFSKDYNLHHLQQLTSFSCLYNGANISNTWIFNKQLT